jgi:tRNA threonylcarbamoyladenosine biosynthesis protein TsaE
MNTYEINSYSDNESKKLAARLVHLLKAGDVITLEGDLGAGKTTFTKGIAEGLGVKRKVTSPTFTIIKEYDGLLPLYHMDAYRLENSEEDIGFFEYFNGTGISVVEWAQFIEEFLPRERLNIKISYLDDESSRLISFQPKGKYYERIIEEFVNNGTKE